MKAQPYTHTVTVILWLAIWNFMARPPQFLLTSCTVDVHFAMQRIAFIELNSKQCYGSDTIYNAGTVLTQIATMPDDYYLSWLRLRSRWEVKRLILSVPIQKYSYWQCMGCISQPQWIFQFSILLHDLHMKVFRLVVKLDISVELTRMIRLQCAANVYSNIGSVSILNPPIEQ